MGDPSGLAAKTWRREPEVFPARGFLGTCSKTRRREPEVFPTRGFLGTCALTPAPMTTSKAQAS
eukprot:4115557-Pyramimonas_sp.AAC.1